LLYTLNQIYITQHLLLTFRIAPNSTVVGNNLLF